MNHKKDLKVRFTDIDGKKYNVIDRKLSAPLVNMPVPVNKQGDYKLFHDFHKMDSDLDCNFDIKHYGLVKNELIKRGLIDGDILSLNDYGCVAWDEF